MLPLLPKHKASQSWRNSRRAALPVLALVVNM